LCAALQMLRPEVSKSGLETRFANDWIDCTTDRGDIPNLSFETDIVFWLPQLRRYARALTGDAAWADDLVQDTFERALTKRWLWRPTGSLRAWLLTLLRNLYIDELRSHREIAVDEQSAPWHALESVSGEIDGLVLRDIQRAMYNLPLDQREVLLLIGLEDLSYRDAAQILHVPLGTVMSRLSRAREQMRAQLSVGSGARSALKVVRNTP